MKSNDSVKTRIATFSHESERHDVETRDPPEVAGVSRRNTIIKVQRGRADQQIIERELDPFRSLLAFDTACQSRDLERDWMNGQVADESFDELQPPLLPGGVFGAVRTVGQLRNRHDGNADLNVTLAGANLFKDLANGMSAAFTRNQNR